MESTQQFMDGEKRRALYVQAPVSNGTVIAISSLMLWILWDHLPQDALMIWCALMWCAAFLRLNVWYRQRADRQKPDRYWIRLYTLYSTWVGISWALMYLFLFSFENLVVTVSLLMLLFGVISSSFTVLSVHLPAFIGYAYPQILVFVVVMVSQQTFSFYLMAGAGIIFMAMLTLFGRNSFKQFQEMVELAYRNRLLVSDLNAEVDRREAIIAERTKELRDENQVRKQTEQALIKQKESYVHLAQHDPLTGLPNRVLMTDRLEQSIHKARRLETRVAVLFLDLDNFKDINDSLGHTAGDQLLQGVAGRLVASVREEDTVARLGGDEFTIIFDRVRDLNPVNQLAHKLIEHLREPFELQERAIRVTTSIGISLYPSDGDDIETLLRNADTAMYQAKAEGRNAVRFYSQELTRLTTERMAMEADLRQALEYDQFELVWQPQYDLKTGRLIGAEALIRWRHPDKGVISPVDFIPVAEASELIDKIGDWVLKHVCEMAQHWKPAELGIRLAVNISGRHMAQESIVDTIESLAAETGCDLGGLELEITEGLLIKDPMATRQILEQLKALGLVVAIDDFGTGYSSLSYLKQFPIHKIKIDQAFVRDIQVDSNDQAIVDAIIALGQKLGLTVIAEGVEQPEQAEYLRLQGCDQVQGYLYARPMSEDEFAELLLAESRLAGGA